MEALVRSCCVVALGVAMIGCQHGSSGASSAGGGQASANAAEPAGNASSGAADPSTTQAAATTAPDENRLYGTWVANDVDVQLGQVKIQLTFKKQGRMKLVAWSDIPLVGKVRDKTGPYEVNGDVISSQAIRGGTSVKYWFDGGDLVIQYQAGKTVRFHRA